MSLIPFIPPAKRLYGTKEPSIDLSQTSDNILIKNLTQEANRLFRTTPSDNVHGAYQPYRFIEEEYQDKFGAIISKSYKVIVHTEYEKLFEGTALPDSTEEIAKYIFENIIGYDSYYKCPTIIIKDSKMQVTDIVRYRPTSPNGHELPKYFQKKSINKPLNRGKYFLYPFQIEMERLVSKNGFVFFGEGLKNALNALINSIPFVSIESTSNAENTKLLKYIDYLYSNGTKVYGAFDGDKAGEEAFIKINKKLKNKIVNIINFDSGIDFTEYIRTVK